MPKLNPFDKKLRQNISYNMVEIMKLRGINQLKLAEMTGIPQSTLAGYTTMKSTPNVDKTKLIASALRVPVAELDPRFSELNLDDITTNHEQELLLDSYQKLTPQRRKKVMDFIDEQLTLSKIDRLNHTN